MIEAAGWALDHEGGNHTQYKKNSFQYGVPRHNEISDLVVRKWRKVNRQADEAEEDKS